MHREPNHPCLRGILFYFNITLRPKILNKIFLRDLKFNQNCALVNHPTIRSGGFTKDFYGSFCFSLQAVLTSSLNVRKKLESRKFKMHYEKQKI